MYCIDPRRFITRKEIQYFIWHYFANFQNSRFSISNNLFCCKNTKGFSQNKFKALDQTNITQKNVPTLIDHKKRAICFERCQPKNYSSTKLLACCQTR